MSVNRVFLLGKIGQKPELKTLQSGKSVVSFSLATSESYKDKDGNKKTDTEWHNITFFDKQAETIAKYCDKGNSLHIEGRIKSEKYTDKAGVEKVAFKIIGTAFDLQGGNNKEESETKADKKAPQAEQPIDDEEGNLPF
jgi:single-strand DNA-binding protein